MIEKAMKRTGMPGPQQLLEQHQQVCPDDCVVELAGPCLALAEGEGDLLEAQGVRGAEKTSSRILNPTPESRPRGWTGSPRRALMKNPLMGSWRSALIRIWPTRVASRLMEWRAVLQSPTPPPGT